MKKSNVKLLNEEIYDFSLMLSETKNIDIANKLLENSEIILTTDKRL